jgi:hypothetical protein
MRVGARLGDDRAAITVADEDGGTVLAVEDAVGRDHVVGKRRQRLLHDADGIAVLRQEIGDGLPTRSIGKGAMDQDDVTHRAGRGGSGGEPRQGGDRDGGKQSANDIHVDSPNDVRLRGRFVDWSS